MNNYKLAIIPPALIPVVWDYVYPMLLDICDLANGEMTPDTILARCERGDSILLSVVLEETIKCVISLEVVVYDSGLRTLLVAFVSGEGMNEWFLQVEDFCVNMAKNLNCTEIRGMAVRDGWGRFLKDKQYKQTHVIYTKQVEV